jgi:hypothetical protein
VLPIFERRKSAIKKPGVGWLTQRRVSQYQFGRLALELSAIGFQPSVKEPLACSCARALPSSGVAWLHRCRFRRPTVLGVIKIARPAIITYSGANIFENHEIAAIRNSVAFAAALGLCPHNVGK